MSSRAQAISSNSSNERYSLLPGFTEVTVSSIWDWTCKAADAAQSYLGREVKHLTSEQRFGAEEIKRIHDLVEEVAYRAFANAVIELGICEDSISCEQSNQILYRIKAEAHKEMYKKDGYISQRTKLLEPSQVEKVITSVGRIVHDRDSKLTYARYNSLSTLLLGLDDHNTMVKEILVSSWFHDETFSDPDHTHLESVKEKAEFYTSLDKTLRFDLKKALQNRKQFWDQYFPGMRNDGPNLSEKFTQILEARTALGAEEGTRYDKSLEKFVLRIQSREIIIEDLSKSLSDYLTPSEISILSDARTVNNAIYRRLHLVSGLFTAKELSEEAVESLLKRYLPEFFVD